MKKIHIAFAIPLALAIVGCGNKNNRTTKGSNTTTSKTITNTKNTSDKPITTTPVENKTIYVSNNGKATNDGLTPETATSFNNAFEIMNSGDTIQLLSGTYKFENRIEISNSGSEIKRNTLECEDGVVFDFSKTKTDSISANGGILISGSYWQISRLNVIKSDNYGFDITGKGNKFISCSSKENNYGGFSVDSSLTTFTNCIAEANYLTGYNAYGFSIKGKGENNSFESCVSVDNQDSGFFVNAEKQTIFTKCLSINNGLNGDSGSSQRSGFIFNNKGHKFTNCIAYNNAKFGFLVPLAYPEKGSFYLTNCSAINNHEKNYYLRANSTDAVEITGILSFNNYDGNNDGIPDASNDYIIGKVQNSIVFYYNKSYYYVKSEQKYNPLDTEKEPINMLEYTNKYQINLVLPEEMKEYKEGSTTEYTIKYFKDGVLNIFDYLDRSTSFQDELFTKQLVTNPKYFGANVNE